MITQKELEELLHYDPETGAFTWIVKRSGAGLGNVAGHKEKRDGYIRIKVKDKKYPAHRLAWLYMTGEWPENYIDHINGIRDDNRWGNLRDVTHRTNCENQRVATGETGYLGVYKSINNYRARIKTNGRNIDLGSYKTPEEAHQAYLRGKRKYHKGCTI